MFGDAWWSRLDQEVRGSEDGVEVLFGRDRLTGESWSIRRAKRESAAAARLEHEARLTARIDESVALRPVMVTLRDRVALVYPTCSGRSLAEVGFEPISTARLLDIAIGAARALVGLHAAHIVHQRISPSHIFLRDEGGVLLCGFDCAAAVDLSPPPALALPSRGMAYIAPEQARLRDQRSDTRSDLYAIGAVLYELATGHPPLSANTTAEWLHAYVAVDAPDPIALRAWIPAMIGAVLLKLIAKDPADRYQSAAALLADLTRCRKALLRTGEIETFELARGELATTPLATNRLFGRSAELASLVEAYGRMQREGAAELVIVSGEAGVGKSSLVEHLLSLVSSTGAHFAVGKSDPLQREMPYAAFVQILRSVIVRLLSEGMVALEAARARLITNIGGYGRLLVDLVPEAEFLVGGAALPNVSARLAQARTARVILQTIAAFASAETPLIVFLDDLQWIDDASLDVIRGFLADPPRHVLLVGSSRVEELASRAELNTVLVEARASGLRMTEINLTALSDTDTTELIANALNSSPADVTELAEAIYRKTEGNAFYVRQILRELVDDKIVAFDPTTQRWRWDGSRVGGQHTVAEFMLRRLDALAPGQRELLRTLACAGGRGSVRLLMALIGCSEAELDDISLSLQDGGLLLRQGDDFVVGHDRVFEAAYALTPEAERPVEHGRIARVMVEVCCDKPSDLTFQIAPQIERASDNILAEETRLAFVRILLAAAHRSRGAGAVQQAVRYLNCARSLMLPDWRANQRALVFDVELLHCECLLGLAEIEDVLASAGELLAFAERPIDKAEVLRLQAIAHTVRSNYLGAIDAALAGVSLLGIALPRQPDEADLDEAYAICRRKLASRTLDGVLELPDATDPQVRSALALLSTLISSAFIDSGLRFLHVAKIVELTLDHGVTPEAAYGLAWFGVLSAHHYGAYEDGYAYAMTALQLARREGFEGQRTATLVALDQVSPWTKPLRFVLSCAREAVDVGHAAGDVGMACYARNHVASDLLALGEPLQATRAEIESGLAWTRRFGYRDIEHILEAQLALVDALASGDYKATSEISDQSIVSIPTLFFVYYYAGTTAFLFGDMDAALSLLERAMSLTWAAPAHIDAAQCNLFHGLALARSSDGAVGPKLERLAELRERFIGWAKLNPVTFRGKLILIEAEMARLGGDSQTAQLLYEEAARCAESAGFVHEQALACELAGDCCISTGLRTAAHGYFRAAGALYEHWGANGKAHQIRARIPSLGDELPSLARSRDGQTELDLAVITKAAQTLSGEIGLESVMETLMREMVIHAGAQCGLLLLMRGENAVIEAVARVVQQEIKVHIGSASPTAKDLPLAVLNMVLRTKRAVVFSDAFADAPYLRAGGPTDRVVRSLLCLPLIKRGELVGILYLENNLASDVFTASRTAMLEILAPQAAISLDAARLYKDLIDENARRAGAEQALRQARSELARTSHLTAMGELAASITHEINQPLASIVTNTAAAVRWLDRPQPDIVEAMAGLENARTAGLRAAGIIKSLRSLAKQATVTFSPVVVEDLIEEVLRLTSTESEASQVRVVRQLEAERSTVLADPVQLQQVIYNLVTNGIDAMAHTPLERRELRVETQGETGAVSLRVSDSGSGMAPDILQRIFEPFFTTKSTGMGMGLAICRSIVEAHGSKLEVQSSLDGGSSFSFCLKLAR